jgi:hypothetical protein
MYILASYFIDCLKRVINELIAAKYGGKLVVKIYLYFMLLQAKVKLSQTFFVEKFY